MNQEKIIFELFTGLPRQGPGSAASTRRAYEIIPETDAIQHIVDVGCGKRNQTLELARISEGDITDIDIHQPFLDELELRFLNASRQEQLITACESMFDLPFEEDAIDVLWCEGAIYIMGVKKALREWKPFLKSGGHIAFSEVCWLQPDPPPAPRKFWDAEYPAMMSVDAVLDVIGDCGYHTLGHFTLPHSDWWDDFYTPLQGNVNAARIKYAGNAPALEVVERTQQEIDTYREFSDWYGYVFFIAENLK